MVALLLAGALAVQPCGPAAAAVLEEAAARLASFDTSGALDGLGHRAEPGCEAVEVAEIYLGGLEAAADAYRDGGSASSLGPVREAIARLDRKARGQAGPAEIARLVLLAATAAAQSERDEMNAFLIHAVEMEVLQRAAGQPGAPLRTAGEMAGELWLRVYRYEDARRAYLREVELAGRNPRIMLGLARVEARMKEVAAACSEYHALLGWWGSPPDDLPELAEARAFVQQPECGQRSGQAP